MDCAFDNGNGINNKQLDLRPLYAALVYTKEELVSFLCTVALRFFAAKLVLYTLRQKFWIIQNIFVII